MNLEYELINYENIDLAVSIQHTVFPEECAYEHYKYSIDTNYEKNKYYIIKCDSIPVGVIGLYIDNSIDKDSIWLGWYGILPEFRSKGIGRQSILDIIDKAKEYGKKCFRLYTRDDGTSTARPLYRSVMQIYEKYDNEDDCNYDGYALVYSYSLTNEEVKPWNNRFLNLKKDIEEEQSGNEIWGNKYRILILSDFNHPKITNDLTLATELRKDGNIVNVTYLENNNKFDIVVKGVTSVKEGNFQEDLELKQKLKNENGKIIDIKNLKLNNIEEYKEYIYKYLENREE